MRACATNKLISPVLCFLVVLSLAATGTRGEDLQQKAFSTGIKRMAAGRDVSLLVMNISSGDLLAFFNEAPLLHGSHGIGSLIKPITALAYLRARQDQRSPIGRCPRTAPGASRLQDCWYHPGHGNIDLSTALAVSCNTYFFELAQRIDWHSFLQTLWDFQIVEESLMSQLEGEDTENFKIEVLIGRNNRLPIRPIDVACALASLFNGGTLFKVASDRSVTLRRITVDTWHPEAIRRGMRESALHGTGKLAGAEVKDLFTKTGTSGVNITRNVSRAGAEQTEAWCVAIAPKVQPPLLVMARVLPGRGASDAAPLAGQSLKLYLDLIGGRP